MNQRRLLLLVLAILASADAQYYDNNTAIDSNSPQEEQEALKNWRVFVSAHNFSIPQDESFMRYKIFKNTFLHVKSNNEGYSNGTRAYAMRLYHFAALSFKEIEQRYLGVRFPAAEFFTPMTPVFKTTTPAPSSSSSSSTSSSSTTTGPPSSSSSSSTTTTTAQATTTTTTTTTSTTPSTTSTPAPTTTTVPSTIPVSWDWRLYNVVTPVKNQLQCGSCWAFSVTGALEGAYALKNKALKSFSEQQLVDCTQGVNFGCGGGWPASTFDYVAKSGIMDSPTYPYSGKDGTCAYLKAGAYKNFTGFLSVPSGDEEALKKAVFLYGPISVVISVESSFYYYAKGVFNTACIMKTGNHAVLVVGYGTENGKDYWIVKNSWGPTWGEAGYIRMARNSNNLCLIASWATFPTLL